MSVPFPIIDAHLHLWDLNKLEYPWLDSVPAIKKNFLIEDYQHATANIKVDGMVFVQCECRPGDYLKEIEFVMEQSRKDNRIKAVVAYAPVELGQGLEPVLEKLKSFPLVKGVRRMFDDNPEICYSESFLTGLRLLSKYGFSFDISIEPSSIPSTIQMIRECPDTFFILDHLGKPSIKDQQLDLYQQHMDQFASFPNLVAKLSGLITEANWNNWNTEQLRPYVEYAMKKFGADRLLFGGDWPVVLLSGSYQQWINAIVDILKNCNWPDLQSIFYTNAIKTYRIS